MLRRVPALLIVCRFLLGPLLCLHAARGGSGEVFVTGLVAALLSDFFDGVIARRLDVATPRSAAGGGHRPIIPDRQRRLAPGPRPGRRHCQPSGAHGDYHGHGSVDTGCRDVPARSAAAKGTYDQMSQAPDLDHHPGPYGHWLSGVSRSGSGWAGVLPGCMVTAMRSWPEAGALQLATRSCIPGLGAS